MISIVEYIQNGFIFVSWVAAGWLVGAAVTAYLMRSSKNK
jgi:hypothetical protein